jgi:hypothetical protein
MRINSGVFLVVYLMLFGTPFTFCLLPLFILVVPLSQMWSKPSRRNLWRWGSLFWLVLSLGVGGWCAFSVQREQDGVLLRGCPLGRPIQSPEFSFFSVDESWQFNWVAGLNISIVTGTLMLPLSAISAAEARRRRRLASPVQA